MGVELRFGYVRTMNASLHQSLVLHSSYIRYVQDKHEFNKMGFGQQLTRKGSAFISFSHSLTALSVISGAAYLLGPAVAGTGMFSGYAGITSWFTEV